MKDHGVLIKRSSMGKVETKWWTCNPTSSGRCGIQNSCGIDLQKYLMRIKGNLASGSNYRGGPIESS
jgi:hypothetical protein